VLKTPAPYPQVGSYALTIDLELPASHQHAELVRIHRIGPVTAAISFPLRTGASGNRTIARADLIDATPLTKDEERRLTDLERDVRGRDRPNKAKVVQATALRSRLIMSAVMKTALDKLAHLDAVEQRFGRAAAARHMGLAA